MVSRMMTPISGFGLEEERPNALEADTLLAETLGCGDTKAELETIPGETLKDGPAEAEGLADRAGLLEGLTDITPEELDTTSEEDAKGEGLMLTTEGDGLPDDTLGDALGLGEGTSEDGGEGLTL